MFVFADETIFISKTFSDTTPESMEQGEFDKTGSVWYDASLTIAELINEIEDLYTYECSGNTLYGEWNCVNYREGRSRQYALHLSTANPLNDTKRIKNIWDAIHADDLHIITDDDGAELNIADDRRSKMRGPVHDIFMDDFNEKQITLEFERVAA